ncbi:MAG: MarC family protein [Bacteroidota bacterium]|nr:MarC family protein [Bacteroidota bacterium]MDX5426504.1 MarC family protein [Bacteroidota bacterium]MDX5448070.1 MarC family protein [Bacteroidota bacterium]MDX5504531.1 MarC family protein [Bacteroidota bacterium]
MVLFAVIDILGSIPLIISLRERVGHIQSEKASIVATIIMVAFLYLGERILNVLGVDVGSFAVAGSFVLFFLAIEMILGVRLYKDEEPESASIVPIAFPLIAGAGTLTTLVSIKAEYETINILIAIFINMVLVYGVLKSSKRLSRLFGKSGLSILRKVFGIILLAISVKLFTSNVVSLF